MPVTPKRVLKRATALVRTDPTSVKTGLFALSISTAAGLVAGLILGGITGRLVDLPGLIILVPAAAGIRGNVFGALSSRLATMTRLGDFKFSRRITTPVGQNIAASIILSISSAFVLAIVAKVVSEAFGINDALRLVDFFAISIIGSIIPTIFVLLLTIALARQSNRRDWDLDNIGAPLVTAAGDIVTIPSLLMAAVFAERGAVTFVIAFLCAFVSLALLVFGITSKWDLIKQIVRQSMPVLLLGGSISILAGLTLQGRLDSLAEFPLLIVLVPPLLSMSGAIGSILSGRIATKLHLGVVRSDKFTLAPITEDITIVYLMAFPIFLCLSVVTLIFGSIGDLIGPGVILTLLIGVVAGIITTTFSNVIGYLTAISTYRFGMDPDNFAIPVVASTSDLIGTIVLMTTIGVLGV